MRILSRLFGGKKPGAVVSPQESETPMAWFNKVGHFFVTVGKGAAAVQRVAQPFEEVALQVAAPGIGSLGVAILHGVLNVQKIGTALSGPEKLQAVGMVADTALNSINETLNALGQQGVSVDPAAKNAAIEGILAALKGVATAVQAGDDLIKSGKRIPLDTPAPSA